MSELGSEPLALSELGSEPLALSELGSEPLALSEQLTLKRRSARRGRCLSLAALTGVVAVVLSGCDSLSRPADPTTAPATVTQSASGSAPATHASTPAPRRTPLGKPVKVSSVQGDGGRYGVGLPLIVRFSASPTSAREFVKAAKVTVNGKPTDGAWYFERPFADSPTEAHFRPKLYWPARSRVHVGLPVKGLSAGKGLSFANDLTLDYSIGPSHISVIDSKKLTMTVYADGRMVRAIPVSLGASKTPTFVGTKVVMEKNRVERMVGPGYDENVPWSVRITNSGEFIHAAAWNTRIGLASTSNGCTNLRVSDATWFFQFSQVGDVAQYPNASGSTMPSWDGYGDWNLNWSTWSAGGVLATR